MRVGTRYNIFMYRVVHSIVIDASEEQIEKQITVDFIVIGGVKNRITTYT